MYMASTANSTGQTPVTFTQKYTAATIGAMAVLVLIWKAAHNTQTHTDHTNHVIYTAIW